MTTESESETLVTQEMLDRKGVWGREHVSPPISESDIRKWAIAVHWPKTPPPIFWDAEYAAGTRWGGIIAPPDFNPFAWPVTVERPARSEAAETNTPRSGKGRRGMNGGQVDTYGVPMRPGDVITSGSPAGVIAGRENPVWLKPGDRVEATIERLGTLVSVIAADRH